MGKQKALKVILCSILVLSMVLPARLTVFAADDRAGSVSNAESAKSCIKETDKKGDTFEKALNELVQEGKLSKEKARKIIEFKKERKKEIKKQIEEQKITKQQCGRMSLMAELKKAGIITDAEALAIRAKLHELKMEKTREFLEGLVAKGVLKESNVKDIENYMNKAWEESREEHEKLKSMTPEERKAYFENKKSEHKDIITKMVEDKLLTETQAAEVRKALQRFLKSKNN
ncbi:MAG: hypothetical protein ACM3TR_18565 [Caulobacteraceae bacterium]